MSVGHFWRQETCSCGLYSHIWSCWQAVESLYQQAWRHTSLPLSHMHSISANTFSRVAILALALASVVGLALRAQTRLTPHREITNAVVDCIDAECE